MRTGIQTGMRTGSRAGMRVAARRRLERWHGALALGLLLVALLAWREVTRDPLERAVVSAAPTATVARVGDTVSVGLFQGEYEREEAVRTLASAFAPGSRVEVLRLGAAPAPFPWLALGFLLVDAAALVLLWRHRIFQRAWQLWKLRRPVPRPAAAPAVPAAPVALPRLELLLSPGSSVPALHRQIGSWRAELRAKWGFPLPPVQLTPTRDLARGRASLLMDGSEVLPLKGPDLVGPVAEYVSQHLPDLLGVGEVEALLEPFLRVEAFRTVAREVGTLELTSLLRRLLGEGFSLRNLERILEVLAGAPPEEEARMEALREALEVKS